jgi:hypothetical protein
MMVRVYNGAQCDAFVEEKRGNALLARFCGHLTWFIRKGDCFVEMYGSAFILGDAV